MATWNSSKFPCQSWHSVYPKGTSDYYEWSYQTTADILTIRKFETEQRCAYGDKIYPAKIEELLMGPNEGYALYKCLRNWVRTYRNDKVLERLDSEELNA